MVRGAGFPARLVENLATRELRQSIQAYEAARRATGACFATLHAQVLALDIPHSKARTKLLRALKKSRQPASFAGIPGGDAMSEALAASLSHEERALAELGHVFAEADAVVSRNLAAIAEMPLFAEAVTWQNPTLATSVLPRVQRAKAPVSRSERRAQRTVASYLQRYCLKNDTIGFFGPIGWGTIEDEGEARCEAGPTLLAGRRVFFEDWAVHALAAHYSDNLEVLPWARPRLHRAVRFDGTTLVFPGRGEGPAPEFARILLSLADGRTAREISQELLSRKQAEFDTEEEVYEALDQLVQDGVLIWRFELPSTTGEPLACLARQLAEIPTEAGQRAVAELQGLEALRVRVEEAAGNPTRLREALLDLHAAFEQLCGTSAQRNHGQTYGGRTPVYEDSLRDLTLSLNSQFFAPVQAAMELVLASARWFQTEGIRRYLAEASELFDVLAANSSSGRVELVSLLAEFTPKLQEQGPSSTLGRLVSELQSTWRTLVGEPADARDLRLSSEEIAEAALQAWRCSPIRTPRSALHSPDLLVSATSADELLEGRGQYVLGEIHVGDNTLIAPCLLRWHKDVDDIARAFHKDVGADLVEPVEPESQVTRASSALAAGPHWELELGTSLSRFRGENCLAVANLVVERVNETLQVVDLSSERRWPLSAVLESALIATLTSAFSPFAGRAHTPRITIDSLVVSRESWHFSGDSMPEFPESRGLEQFLAVRQWAQALGMPRRVFFKAREETKPAFLDLSSPILVENFVTIARKATQLSVSEMLPTPEGTWLKSQDGEAFTAELRFVVRDRQ